MKKDVTEEYFGNSIKDEKELIESIRKAENFRRMLRQ